MKEYERVNLDEFTATKCQFCKGICDKLISSTSQGKCGKVVRVKSNVISINKSTRVFDQDTIQGRTVDFEWHNKRVFRETNIQLIFLLGTAKEVASDRVGIDMMETLLLLETKKVKY